MTHLPLERNVILPRINGIAEDLKELRKLGQLPEKEFTHGPWLQSSVLPPPPLSGGRV